MSEITAPEQEVVDICRDLLRIDTTNYGPGKDGPGERAAADYVVAQLREVGLDPQLFESEPGRATVAVRIPGADRERGALCIHGHLDVVPANAEDWTHPPFDAVEADGCLWGRGAVDMKDMDAMMLACVRHLARTGTVPPRDLLFVFFADEEAGGVLGSRFLVREHPEVFDGVTEAISEVGGYSVTVDDAKGDPRRAYLLQTAEKGIAWLTLRAKGTAGHGSVPTSDNPIVHLAEAIARIDGHKWPREFTVSVRGLLDGLAELTGVGYSDEDAEALLERIGPAAGFVRGALQDTANVTMLEGGYKHNVIPGEAAAALDCRYLPDHGEALLETIRELAGEHVEVVVDHWDISLASPFEGEFVEKMRGALLAEDPEASILPYCLSGGTDNKALSTIGVTGYGFAPLRLPAELDFAPMFHGVDERVPLESLEFGARVLWRLIGDC